jgi:hypothetical protein
MCLDEGQHASKALQLSKYGSAGNPFGKVSAATSSKANPQNVGNNLRSIKNSSEVPQRLNKKKWKRTY